MAVYVLVHAEAGRRTANATRALDAPAGIAARVLVDLVYLAWAAAVAAWA
jgi:hypothetical protein